MKQFQPGCFGLLLGVVALAGCRPEPRLEPPPEYVQVRDGLLAEGEFRHYPAIDPTGCWMIFARNNRAGLEYGLMDLRTRTLTTLVTNARGNYQDAVADLYAWSPDGRWLALVEPAGLGATWTVRVRNMASGAVEETGLKLEFQDLIWLEAERFGVRAGSSLLLVERVGSQWKPNYGKRFSLMPANINQPANAKVQTSQPPGIDWKTLTLSEPGRVAFGLAGNLWEFDGMNRQLTQPTDWPAGKIRWLDYSPTRRAFLFSMETEEAGGRLALCKWHREGGPTTAPTQLTGPGISALKGRWIAGGYAYVADQPDQSQLIVVHDGGPTNILFAAGSVWSYEAGADGRVLSAIASEALEPLGIWRIETATGDQERVLAQKGYAPKVDRQSVTNGLGQRVNYTVFRPGHPNQGPAHPVLFLPAHGRLWSELSRVLPRLGMIEVMPGLDKNTMGTGSAAQDTLRTVREHVALKYPVDTNRFYLEGMSVATAALAGIIEVNPGVFRGLILDSPVADGLPGPELLKREGLEVLVTVGTADALYDVVQKYVASLRRAGVPVWSVEIKGMGHAVGNSEELEQRIRATAAFIHRSAPAIRN